MKQSHYTIIGLVLIALAFGLTTFFHNAEKNAQVAQQVTEHSDSLIRNHSVRAGNPLAKVTIVEFLDPACKTCLQFHPMVKDLILQYGDKVNLVVRYAPLHPGSEQMVAILEAVKMQGQFWPVLELMFETQTQWAINHRAHPEKFWNILVNTKKDLDYEKLQQDMNNPAISQAIQQDVADGQLLGATKTPTFFVNGKPLPSFGFEQLHRLVSEEVAEHY